MFTCGWIWLYLGAFLMLAEIVSPGFVIFFFGLSAATVGICRFAIGDAFTLTWQLASFSVFSVLYLVTLRRLMKRLFSGNASSSSVDFNQESVGRIARTVAVIRPPLSGRILLGDAEWSAVADVEIPEGADVRVVAQDNLTMKVVPV